MIADPEGPSFIIRTVGHRRYSDGAFVTHDPQRTFYVGHSAMPAPMAPLQCAQRQPISTECSGYASL